MSFLSLRGEFRDSSKTIGLHLLMLNTGRTEAHVNFKILSCGLWLLLACAWKLFLEDFNRYKSVKTYYAQIIYFNVLIRRIWLLLDRNSNDIFFIDFFNFPFFQKQTTLEFCWTANSTFIIKYSVQNSSPISCQKRSQRYFVTKIVLTYCEKRMF